MIPSKVKLIISTLVLSLFCNLLQAMPDQVKINHDGSMVLSGLDCSIVHYTYKYRRTTQSVASIRPDNDSPEQTVSEYDLKGRYYLSSNNQFFYINEIINQVDKNSIDYSAQLLSDTPVGTAGLGMFINLPVQDYMGKSVNIDGQDYTIPFKASYLKAEKVELKTKNGKLIIEGDLNLSLADHRSSKVNIFTLRLNFDGGRGKVRKAALAAKFTLVPQNDNNINLNNLASEKYNPRKYKLRAGKPAGINNISFAISNKFIKVENNAKTIQAEKISASWLYLLHNSKGTVQDALIKAVYTDGTESKLPVKQGYDVADEVNTKALGNGAVGLVNLEADHWRGIYFSKFKLDAKPLKEITFSAGKGIWQIYAVTTSNKNVTEPKSKVVAYPDENWIEVPAPKSVKKGTPLDFSKFTGLEAPAGKYGRIITDSKGHFVTEKDPQKRLRFLGSNLCFSANYLNKEEAENLADEIAASGFNAIRFHHFDRDLSKKGAKSSTELDMEKLDKLDYLFYCMKKRGIYVTIDLYCSRNILPGELKEYPELKGRCLKSLCLVYPPARKNWKEFTSNLLLHKNKYTGMTWAEDPAIYSVILINEGTLFEKSALLKDTVNAKVLKEAFNNWLKAKNISKEESDKKQYFLEFITQMHNEMYREFKDYLQEIGYNGLVSNLNNRRFKVQTLARKELDFVDNHDYWDHPQFLPGHNWSFPYVYGQSSSLNAGLLVPGRMGPPRIFGKPYTISEINFVYPNKYRFEEGPILGAYSALQDWDGIFFFARAHSRDIVLHKEPVKRFDSAGDPLKFISQRIVSAMFVRNMVQPAKAAYAIPYGKNMYKNNDGFSKAFQDLGFISRVGCASENSANSGINLLVNDSGDESTFPEAAKKQLSSQHRISDTGEVSYNTRDLNFKVTAPEIESLIAYKNPVKGRLLAINSVASPQNITAMSIDGKELSKSKKILIFHQVNALNKFMIFNSENMFEVSNWGKGGSILLQRCKADISLELIKPENKKITALNWDGTVLSEISSRVKEGKLTFCADTANKTMIYMISDK